jgi:hypothetical protein
LSLTDYYHTIAKHRLSEKNIHKLSNIIFLPSQLDLISMLTVFLLRVKTFRFSNYRPFAIPPRYKCPPIKRDVLYLLLNTLLLLLTKFSACYCIKYMSCKLYQNFVHATALNISHITIIFGIKFTWHIFNAVACTKFCQKQQKGIQQ